MSALMDQFEVAYQEWRDAVHDIGDAHRREYQTKMKAVKAVKALHEAGEWKPHTVPDRLRSWFGKAS